MASLDRIIDVDVQAPGAFVSGVYVPGPVTTYRVWAERLSVGSTDIEERQGTRIETVVRWRIRWRVEIARADVDRVAVRAEERSWNVEGVSESDERKRYLFIQAISGDRLQSG